MILNGLSPGKAWENSHFATAISAISGHPGLTRNVFFGQILRPAVGQHQLPARAVRPSMSVRTWSFGFMIWDRGKKATKPSTNSMGFLGKSTGTLCFTVLITFSKKNCEQRHLSAKKKTRKKSGKKTSCSALCRIRRAL